MIEPKSRRQSPCPAQILKSSIYTPLVDVGRGSVGRFRPFRSGPGCRPRAPEHFGALQLSSSNSIGTERFKITVTSCTQNIRKGQVKSFRLERKST